MDISMVLSLLNSQLYLIATVGCPFPYATEKIFWYIVFIIGLQLKNNSDNEFLHLLIIKFLKILTVLIH